MSKLFAALILFISSLPLYTQPMQAFITPFEQDNNYSANYAEMMAFYNKLITEFPTKVMMQEVGPSDCGLPIHVIVYDQSGDFQGETEKTTLLINNAIHPGEPCGVDASMMFLRNILLQPEYEGVLKNTRLVIIPAYNLGGMLNRGSSSRANQDGPKLYGFRGNARNYDLNRDFVKVDTRNAETFSRIFQKWNPDVFIDNHTSNGADYQYTMTLIATQKDKLEKTLSSHLTSKMLPFLYQYMQEAEWEMTPYVYARNTPDEGIYGFLDLPRYSTGYASLFHTIGFMPETHMLKPYKDRVLSTLSFMNAMIHYLEKAGKTLTKDRSNAILAYQQQDSVAVQWTLSDGPPDSLLFKGFEAGYSPSHIHGDDRLYYDHEKPYSKEVPFHNNYNEALLVKKPSYYIIPQAYQRIITLMALNGVEMEPLEKDEVVDAQMYYITDFKTVERPYEGHYLHSDVTLKTVTLTMQFYKGDMKVSLRQNKDAYIMHMLEPQSSDSFFAWNFFDAILMQKEYYSDYVFEDLAFTLLEEDPTLKEAFTKKKKTDASFAKDSRAQLNFIYENSPYKEPTHNLYPIARIITD